MKPILITPSHSPKSTPDYYTWWFSRSNAPMCTGGDGCLACVLHNASCTGGPFIKASIKSYLASTPAGGFIDPTTHPKLFL